MAPPVPIPNTWIFKLFINKKYKVLDWGSIRKPFKVQYSDRTKIRLPFNALGDRTIAIDQILERTEIPSGPTSIS